MHDKVAYAQSVAAVSAGTVTWLTQANLVVSLLAGLVSVAVGCVALYRFYKNWGKDK